MYINKPQQIVVKLLPVMFLSSTQSFFLIYVNMLYTYVATYILKMPVQVYIDMLDSILMIKSLIFANGLFINEYLRILVFDCIS